MAGLFVFLLINNYILWEEMKMANIKEAAQEIKEEVKTFYKKHENEIKIGLKVGVGCLAFGFISGFVKSTKIHNSFQNELIKRLPYAPDCDDIEDYILTHLHDPEAIAKLKAVTDTEEFNEIIENLKNNFEIVRF